MQQAKAVETKVNNYLQILAQPKYHKAGATPEARLKLAKKILNALLSADTDNPNFPQPNVNQKSYTRADVSSIGNPPRNIKLPAPSTYESYTDCVSAIQASPYNQSQSVAEDYCRSVNADDSTKGQSAPKSGMSLDQCISHGLQMGLSQNSAEKICNAIKQPSDTDNTTPSDKFSETKSSKLRGASSTIPSWAHAIFPDGLPSQPVKTIAPSNLKSASENYIKNQILYNANPYYRAIPQESSSEKRIKSAKVKDDKIPYWAKAIGAVE